MMGKSLAVNPVERQHIYPMYLIIAITILSKSKVFCIGFLSSSLALLSLGIFLLVDGGLVLLHQHHPIIPVITVFDHQIWFGYFMVIALLWSSIP
ncbi:MAG: hypothetical protein A3F13_10075 [Gammaproteobacteria bacterium RIFCSPHIGHO2_12_FULL_40_19]|nr:MAG: hypothetical protein A3F13_10075 [Gammaproteobacteria bacterium RIFCSPHIGHO2_12_FULL_40_19]